MRYAHALHSYIYVCFRKPSMAPLPSRTVSRVHTERPLPTLSLCVTLTADHLFREGWDEEARALVDQGGRMAAPEFPTRATHRLPVKNLSTLEITRDGHARHEIEDRKETWTPRRRAPCPGCTWQRRHTAVYATPHAPNKQISSFLRRPALVGRQRRFRAPDTSRAKSTCLKSKVEDRSRQNVRKIAEEVKIRAAEY